jgi:2'-5' RNA ligase
MYGITAMLDTKHDAMVETLWAEFRQKFGVHGVSAAPVPHFSFHLAARYDCDEVERLLCRFAAETPPFTVRTNGLGLFTGIEPVLFVPIIRSLKLIDIQARLWEPLSAAATEPSPLYHPEQWRPHITLTHRDVNHDLLPQVIRLLSERDFRWEITIDTLGVLSDKSEPEDDIMFRVRLGTGKVL